MRGYAFYNIGWRVRVTGLDDDIRRTKRLCQRLAGRVGVIVGSHSSPLFAYYRVELEAMGRKPPLTAMLAEWECEPIDREPTS